MRVVFDTNVLIAAFIARGASADIFDHVLGNHTIVVGEVVLRELAEKLRTKFGFPARRVREVVAFLRTHAQVVPAGRLDRRTCRDPDDDAVLAALADSEGDVLLTGDQDLLVLGRFAGKPILPPADSWRWERERGSSG